MTAQVIYITTRGSQLRWLNSLEDLKGYTLSEVEPDINNPSGHLTLILRNAEGSYRVGSRSWEILKHQYQGSPEIGLQNLINQVETELKEAEEKAIRSRRQPRRKNVQLI